MAPWDPRRVGYAGNSTVLLHAHGRSSSGIVGLVPGARLLEHSVAVAGRQKRKHRVYPQCVGYRVTYQRGFGWRALSLAIGAPLPLALNISPARADTDAIDGVEVACPDLPEAPAAELEARARATLLTSDLSATVAISCDGERVVVQVNAGDDSVTLKLRVATATLREEVLRALDRALADLGARLRPDSQTAAVNPTSSTATGSESSQLGPEAAEAPPPTPLPQPARPAAPSTSEMVVGAHVVGEMWGNRPALGGGLQAGVRFDSTWSCGIRAGSLYPLRLREATVVEAHALLEASVTAQGLAGLRFTVGAGPSLLFASPRSGFGAAGPTMKGALQIEAQVGRPFRWHRAELTPWVGARAFTAERGVRVAEQARLVLGGVEPQVGVALSLVR